MKKHIFTLMLATLTLGACHNEEPLFPNNNDPENPEPNINPDEAWTRFEAINLTETQQQMGQQLKSFSWDLFSQTYQLKNKGENILISPFSLNVDLGMLLNGLDETSFDKLRETMNLKDYQISDINEYFRVMVEGLSQDDSHAVFKSANSFWYNKNYKVVDSFTKTIGDVYKAETKSVDFSKKSTVEAINAWCSEKTNKRIPKLLDKTSNLDLFHLINALYFYGKWEAQFDKKQTKKEEFHYADGNKKDVDMMYKHAEMVVAETEALEYITLPFNSYSFSMTFFLPKKGHSITEAIESMKNDQMTSNLYDLQLWLPKFESEYTIKSLPAALNAINPSLNFASLGVNMLEKLPSEKGGDILQKTYIKVDEEGVEAAAVTDIMWVGANIHEPPQPRELKFDRPFFYSINERSTGTPVFIGYYGK